MLPPSKSYAAENRCEQPLISDSETELNTERITYYCVSFKLWDDFLCVQEL